MIEIVESDSNHSLTNLSNIEKHKNTLSQASTYQMHTSPRTMRVYGIQSFVSACIECLLFQILFSTELFVLFVNVIVLHMSSR